VPLTYKLIIEPTLYGEMVIVTDSKSCKCEVCTKRIAKRQGLYKFAWFDKWFLVKLTVIAAFWYSTFFSYVQVKDLEPLNGFVPHELLGVDARATLPEIKKAFRKLSRELHPDKNRHNPKAVNEFIQITKAYTVSPFTPLTSSDHDRPAC